MTASGTPEVSHGRAMAVGSLWMILGRWITRGIGLVSTIILARLLAPADFGLIAMAMLVIGALSVLTETGQRQAIIRMEAPLREHYDTAWTVGLIIGAVVAVALVLAAPLTARLFDEPRLLGIMGILALRPVIQAFENIGMVDYQRRLDFRRDLSVMLIGKLGSFVVTIVLAFVLHDWRALIAGTLAGALISLALSYTFSPYRPRLSLARLGEIWSFSGWALVTNIALFASEKADHAVVAVELDAGVVGAYTIGAEVAAMPTEELVVPPVRALFAVYARLANDLPRLREHYLSALGFIAVVATSTSAGVALVADDMVAVLLGEKWHAAAPLVAWFALAAGAMGVARSVNSVLLAAGHARVNAVRAALFALLLIPLAILGISWHGAEGAAIARFAVTMVFAPVMLALALRLLAITPAAMGAVLWRPVLATLGMTGVVWLLHPHMPAVPLLRLVIEAAAGATAYGASLMMLWWLSGRPAGTEATLWQVLRTGRRSIGSDIKPS